jgi:hypothetical protein
MKLPHSIPEVLHETICVHRAIVITRSTGS